MDLVETSQHCLHWSMHNICTARHTTCRGFFHLKCSFSKHPFLAYTLVCFVWQSNPTIRGLVGDSTLVIDYPFSQRRPIRRHRVPTRGDTCLCRICESVGQNVTLKYSFRV